MGAYRGFQRRRRHRGGDVAERGEQFARCDEGRVRRGEGLQRRRSAHQQRRDRCHACKLDGGGWRERKRRAARRPWKGQRQPAGRRWRGRRPWHEMRCYCSVAFFYSYRNSPQMPFSPTPFRSVLSTVLLSASFAVSAAATPPHIVFILVDDFGRGALFCSSFFLLLASRERGDVFVHPRCQHRHNPFPFPHYSKRRLSPQRFAAGAQRGCDARDRRARC